MMKGEQEQVKLVHWKTPSKEINFEEELFFERKKERRKKLNKKLTGARDAYGSKK